MGALINGAIIAIGLIAGSVNTAVFTSWVERILLPNLPAKHVIIGDNAALYKGLIVPNLNPIEGK